MNQDHTVSINFSEYKKIQDERVSLMKAILVLELENLKYKLALEDSFEKILKAKVVNE